MARRGNPALIGAFVLGAIVLAVGALVVFGGGKFLGRAEVAVAYFDGALKGLTIGSPVAFNGVKIGAVRDIRVVLDERTRMIETPVFFEIDAGRVRTASGQAITFRKDTSALKELIDRGLRAQPEMQSFVTGQMQIGLNFFPDTPVRLTNLSPGYPEVPTIPSRMDQLSDTLARLPLEELVRDLQQTVRSVNALASAPEIRSALAGMNAVIARTDRLVARVTAEVTPLVAKIDAVGHGADTTMAELRQILARLTPTVETTLQQYGTLATTVDAHVAPLGGMLVRVAAAADATLEQAQRTMKSLDAAIDTDSPLRYDLTRALHEVQLAARSLRGLTEYLERHPEAVVSGKRPQAGAQ